VAVAETLAAASKLTRGRADIAGGAVARQRVGDPRHGEQQFAGLLLDDTASDERADNLLGRSVPGRCSPGLSSMSTFMAPDRLAARLDRLLKVLGTATVELVQRVLELRPDAQKPRLGACREGTFRHQFVKRPIPREGQAVLGVEAIRHTTFLEQRVHAVPDLVAWVVGVPGVVHPGRGDGVPNRTLERDPEVRVGHGDQTLRFRTAAPAAVRSCRSPARPPRSCAGSP
jgi:hypothetical protein